MISRSIAKIATLLAVGAMMSSVQAAKLTAKEVLAKVEAEAAAAPADVDKVVGKYVKDYPEYACPIIKAALKGSNAGKSEEPGLIAAAIAVAPERTAEIKACLPTDSQDPFVSDDLFLGRASAITGGAYLASPGGAGGAANPSSQGGSTPTTSTVTRVTTSPVRVVRVTAAAAGTSSTP